MLGETFQNVAVNFVSSNPKCVFHSGEVISGEMRFELSKEVKIQKMSMTLKGKAKFDWSTRSGSGKHRRSRHHSAKLEFFKLDSIVLQAQNDEMVLNRGVHVYPFSCQIPHGNFPSTFLGIYGKISYAVVFGIHRSWHMAKEFISEFKFERPVNVDLPELLMPLSASNSRTLCCFCCTSGHISMDVQMERKGFIPGETIKIMAEIGNGTSQRVVLKAELVQKETYYTKNRGTHRIVPKSVVSAMGPAVEPNTSDVYLELTLPIPEDVYVSMTDCEILDVQHMVRVKLQVRGYSSLETMFPIVLGSSHLQPVPEEECQPPPYSVAAFM
ncbi:hypothetical protein ACEWY4_000233 [Coilia grayii]|uniref:Arrestin C-terminal-like domain-containing protein n=1 Tax=Coilia grayii TaxID=363190 RepID=A0ABD1KW50_9TELE